MKKPFRTFLIHGGAYDFDIHVVVSEDLQRSVNFINRKLHLPDKDNLGYIVEDLDVLGRFAYNHNYCPVIWLPKVPKTPREYATLFHEAFHGVCQIMRWCGVSLVKESEEAFAHLLNHLSTQILLKIKK